MLKHEVIAADKWNDNGPHDLIMVSLCIQIAVAKMQLCSLYGAYACPYGSPGGWSQIIPQVKKPDVEDLGWHGYTWSVVVRPVGRTDKLSKLTLEAAYGREITFNSLATALVDSPAVSRPIAHSLKT